MILNKFWLDNPKELLATPFEIIPGNDMSMERKLNAIARFFIYLGVIMVILYNKNNYIVISIFGILFTVLIYNNHKKEDLEGNGSYFNFEKFEENKQPVVEDTQLFNNKENSSRKVSLEETSNQCRMPTKQNPFMNPLTVEMNTPHLDGCNLSNPKIKETSKDMFYNEIYRDVDDIFQRRNSERQFYTIPSTFDYQDQAIFANWLYNTGNTCKQDSGECFRYEDIRHQFRN